MGGNQSSSTSTTSSSSGSTYITNQAISIGGSGMLFEYDCNPFVAEFIRTKTEYFDELQRTVQTYAKVKSIFSTHKRGVVTLKASVTATSADKDVCKQKLDEYFSRFLSFDEKLDNIIPRSTLDNIINSPGLRCAVAENSMQNSIRITGIQSDVKTMISRLRDAQPPQQQAPTYMEPEVTKSVSITPSVPVHTVFSGVIQVTNVSPVFSSSSATTNLQNNDNVFTNDTTVPQQSTRPVPMPRNSLSQLPLSTFLVFKYQAPDFAVARYIKYSKEHTVKLEQALSHLAQSVTIDASNKKNIEFVCRPDQGIRLTEEKFKEIWQEELLKFLKGYTSRKKHFKKDQLERVHSLNPDFFAKKSNEENEGVHIQWHFDVSLVIMAGPKPDVERKEKEMMDYLNAVAPKYVSPNFVFRYSTQDYSVARFLKQSRIHMAKLEDKVKEIANVRVWISNNKGEDQEWRIEYQCRPLLGLELAENDFKSVCRTTVTTFLEDYVSTIKFFDRNHLLKVYRKHPEFFKNQTAIENQELYVEWQINKNRVRVVGLRAEVDSKLQKIIEFVQTAVPMSVPSRHVCKIKASDHSVARFIKQSPSHMALFEEALSRVATVKIWISAEGGEDNNWIIEYHCRPIPDLDISEQEYDAECRSSISKFLEQYSSMTKFFNHDLLMKAALKEKEFFRNQTSQENQKLFVEWRLEKNRVRIAGRKEDVDAKVNEIIQFLDTAVPRTLRQAYEFDLDPPSFQIAVFIKQNEKHYEAFKDFIENAKVWITREKCSLHFKATVELTQLDIPGFEAKCKKGAGVFFKKYGIWRHPLSKAVSETVQEWHWHLFSNDNDDFRVEIVNENVLQLVGALPAFTKTKTTLSASVQKLLDRNRPSKNPPLVLLRPYVYEPKANANITIIKHLFQSPIDLRKLQEALGEFVHFKVFPNPDTPRGVEFYPKPNAIVDVDYYNKVVPGIVKKFFGRFIVSRKKCLPHEEQRVISQVYEIGWKSKMPERVISIHKENNFLNIVGPAFVIQRITQAIKASNSYGKSVSLRFLPDPNLDQPERKERPRTSRSRRSSTSSASGEPPVPKPRSRATTPVRPPTKTPDKKPGNIVYHPKAQFAPKFSFAWDTLKFREELKSRFDDLCTLEGNSKQLKITSKLPEFQKSNEKQFAMKVVERMENFLTSIDIISIDLDDDVIKYLEENKDMWLESFCNPSDFVELSVLKKKIEIKGFKDVAARYKGMIEEQFQEDSVTTEATSEICRVLSICGVIAETNRQLAGIATITCSVDEGSITCKGRKMFTSYGMTKLADVGHLEEEPPIISEEKAKALKTFLTNKNSKENEGLIQKKFAEKKIKCVLILPSDKVILTAMTKEMYRKGSKYVDELLQLRNIPLSNSLTKDIFKDKAWVDLVDGIQDSTPIIVCLQDTLVRLIGLDELQEAEDKINSFFDRKLRTTRHIRCKEYPGLDRFIKKYCVPQNIEVADSTPGLALSGPAREVDKCVDTLSKTRWSIAKPSFSAPGLLSFVSSNRWKDFVKLWEHDIRCTVHCDTTKCKSEIMEEKIAAPGTSNRDDITSNNVKETTYGSVAVMVRHGDITAENTDVIINGVINRNFDLTRGAVSSALLRRAGSQMQQECDRADKASPWLRSTRGWNLLCNHVIHIVTPTQADELTNRIKEALDHAELLKASSVAIPTLGAGGIGLAADDVAAAFSQAIELFACDKPRHVKSVKIVVFERTLMDLFQSCIVQAKQIMGVGKRAAELAESRAKSSLVDDEVVVYLNTDDADSLNKAKEKVTQCMSDVIVRKVFKEDLLSKFEDNDRFDIFEAAMKHKASVTLNRLSSEIVLKGLKENVDKLYDKIRGIKYELKAAITVSKIANWKWASASSVYSSLPLRISNAIEAEFEKNNRGTCRISMYGSDMQIDFANGTYDFRMISGKIKRGDKDTMVNYPPEWEDMMGKTVKRVKLNQISAEYQRVLKLFCASYPTHLNVLEIERIQNPAQYSQYQIYKRDVEKHMITNRPAERELFHGTNLAGIESILQSGFDRGFAGKNATAYGKGCYFAVHSSYSVRYVDPNAQVKFIFLARVVTGDFCRGRSDMIAPPEKPSSAVARKYDSTVDNESDPSIFAVFKDSSVYPSYLITFH